MPAIPPFNPQTNEVFAPHLFILGAGASKAVLPNGDTSGRVLPVMAELIPTLGLESIFSLYGITDFPNNFEALYDDLASQSSKQHLRNELEEVVNAYFSSITLPQPPTLYDYLLCSLRSKDVIATFNWDPLLWLAYERNMHLNDLPKTLFLHGNVAIGICYKCGIKTKAGGKCPSCLDPVQPSRLLYPVRNKDYTTDPFIASEWQELRATIRSAYLVTIFGYSAPITDAAAREIMLAVWQENAYRELAQFEIVDIRPKYELHNKWGEFITKEHYYVSTELLLTYLFRYPRRSCEAFASASLRVDPWKTNNIPSMNSLDELHNWLQPLIDEEEACRTMYTPLSSKP